MPELLKLSLVPRDVTDHEEYQSVVEAVHEAMTDADLALYARVQDEFEPMEAFMARSPYHALQWICKRISRPKLTQIIQHIYDYPAEASHQAPTLDSNVETDTQPPGGLSTSVLSGSKRKRPLREKSTRELNKQMVEKMNLALVQTVASSQDWAQARDLEGVTVEERKYRDFAKRLPGVGLNTMTQMITKATAVGTMEVFRDWQAILAVWKRQNRYSKKLFESVATTSGRTGKMELYLTQASETIPGTAVTFDSQQGIQSKTDDCGLTSLETERFRFKYFDAQKTQVDGVTDDMRHRWKMDALYEEFEKLEGEIRRRNAGTGARGRRYDTVAKEHLFATTYGFDLGRMPSKSKDADLWHSFGQFLDWGKRWNMMKKRFGSVGIFGLLPRSSISNAFVERGLSQTRVAQWIEMIAECNVDVPAMAVRMEPLFLACMGESAPPEEFAFLEQLDNFTGKPLELFERQVKCLSYTTTVLTHLSCTEEEDNNEEHEEEEA